MNEQKLEVLIALTQEFSLRQIPYAVGASCLLYLHGLVETFNDIDLLVPKEDFLKAASIMEEKGTALSPDVYSGYYRKYVIDEVEFDLMGQFLLHDGEDVIDRSFHKDERSDILCHGSHPISCEHLEKWLLNYELMGRTWKQELLKEYFDQEPVLVKDVLKPSEWLYFLERIPEIYPYPFVTKERLEALQCDPEIDLYTVYGSFEELLCVYPIYEDHYAEVTLFLCRDGETAELFLQEIERRYPGLDIDVVYPPDNTGIEEALKRRGASFEPVQHEMVNTALIDEEHPEVLLYDPVYEEGYKAIHQDEGHYWTAKRVLEEPSFDIYLIVKEGKPAAYLDLMRGKKFDFVYDLYVSEKERGKGYGKALIAEASKSSGKEKLVLTVDEDNEIALHVYSSTGFTIAKGKDTRTAHMKRKEERR